MPAIELTEQQRRRLERVRADVEDAFVDTYGHAELSDAIDYLLDTYTPPEPDEGRDLDIIAEADYTALQAVASDVDGVPGSGIGADEMRGQLLAALGPETLAARLTAGEGADPASDISDTEDEEATDGAMGDEQTTDADDSEDGEAAEDGDSDDETANDDGDGENTGGDGGGVAVASPDDGDILGAANRLLRENDDKWRKPDDSDSPYEVDLPDGTTEGVRTKDDVRQLLFRHYA